jgi:carbonic anhydrase
MHVTRLLLISSMMLGLAQAGLAADVTPATALDRLKAGNARFVAAPGAAPPIDEAARQAQVNGQSPFAIVLSCADSRVPPEIIFNAGLGELFVIRTAGQVGDKAVYGSLEYSAEHLRVPLLVVMGHEACGAVKVTIDTKPGSASQGPNIDALIAAIRPAFSRMDDPADASHLREAVLANVEQVINDLLNRSAVVTHLVSAGKLQIVGAYYEFATGRVRFSQPVTSVPGTAHKEPGGHR